MIVGSACVGGRLSRGPDAGVSSAAVDPDTTGSTTQFLYRIQYAGPEGSGSLRLVLRSASRQRFQLATADTLGRKLWSLEVDGSRSVLIDYREQLYCVGGPELRLAEATLSILPLAAIPRLLQGELPIDLTDGRVSGVSTEYTDTLGRRWSVREEDEQILAWTLWTGAKPTLWWTRQDKGGILSHHDGSQFRWRQVVVEKTGEPLLSLESPEGFTQQHCDDHDFSEFRQGQSAPRGTEAPE